MIKIIAASAVLVASTSILYWAYSLDHAFANAPFLNAFHPTTEALVARGVVGFAGICAAIYLLKVLVGRPR